MIYQLSTWHHSFISPIFTNIQKLSPQQQTKCKIKISPNVLQQNHSNNSLGSQLQFDPIEVGIIRKAKMWRSTWCVSFMMNTIPNYPVILTSCNTSSYCENQFSIESFYQQLQNLISTLVVRKICGSMGAWEVDGSSLASMHAVVDLNCADIFIAIAVHVWADIPGHVSGWLVADHLSENTWANRAFDPIFIPFEVVETSLVQ